jgi:phosphohistidine phosphatase
MRRLLLLRHAKSDWPQGLRDHDRPLSRRGRLAAPQIAVHMLQQDLVPDHALVSTARRTRETWDLVKAAWKTEPPSTFDDRIYEAPASRLLEVLRAAPAEAENLLLIGHNPGIQELARLLGGDEANVPMRRLVQKFPTAALAVLEFSVSAWDELSPHGGRLVAFVTPADLGGEDD